jgi:hypothetical protein
VAAAITSSRILIFCASKSRYRFSLISLRRARSSNSFFLASIATFSAVVCFGEEGLISSDELLESSGVSGLKNIGFTGENFSGEADFSIIYDFATDIFLIDFGGEGNCFGEGDLGGVGYFMGDGENFKDSTSYIDSLLGVDGCLTLGSDCISMIGSG